MGLLMGVVQSDAERAAETSGDRPLRADFVGTGICLTDEKGSEAALPPAGSYLKAVVEVPVTCLSAADIIGCCLFLRQSNTAFGIDKFTSFCYNANTCY